MALSSAARLRCRLAGSLQRREAASAARRAVASSSAARRAVQQWSSSRHAAETVEFAELEARLREAQQQGALEAAATGPALTTSFLSHLAARADAAGDEREAAALGELIGRLLALSETTLLPPPAAALPASASDAEALSLALSAAGHIDDAALARRWEALAWRGEAGAEGLGAEAGEARLRSAAELLGRAPLGPEQTTSLRAPSAEQRILEVLAAIPAGPFLREAVRDALTPADDGGGTDELEEQLATTPLRLLQAIDSALARGGGADEAALRAVRDAVVLEL